MRNKELKKIMAKNLQTEFVENYKTLKSDMDRLNNIISLYGGNPYTYDEYCNARLRFEIEACDLAPEFYTEETATDEEYIEFLSKVMAKSIELDVDYNIILRDMSIDRTLEHRFKIDREFWYVIIKYSQFNMIKNRMPKLHWSDVEHAIEEMSETGARKVSERIAMQRKVINSENLENSIK